MNQTVEEQRNVSCSWTETIQANFSQNKSETFIHTEGGFRKERRVQPYDIDTVTSRPQYDTDGINF